MAGNKDFCQLLADYLEKDVTVPSTTESTVIGAAITAGIGANIFSISQLQEENINSSTVYKPREGIFDHKDFEKWRKFLDVLMDAYN